MKHKTLYVSDMDGTLLDNDSLVSPTSARIISDLSRRGALITVATARTPATVEPLLASTFTRCPAIVMTGGAMWDRDRRELINPRLFAPEVAADVIASFAAHGVNPFIYTVTSPSCLDVYFCGTMNRAEERFYTERRHLRLKKFHLQVVPPPEALRSVILVFAIGPADPVNRLAEVLTQRGGCSVSCYPDIHTPGIALIEVFAEGVSKRDAIERLAASVGADRLVVFGDNLNDLSMMSVADVAVAVDNALPAVKDHASIVIGRNSADAVARFIEADWTDSAQ